MAVLLIAEHNNKELRPFTLNAATAASQIDVDVHAVIIGQNCDEAAKSLSELPLIKKVIHSDFCGANASRHSVHQFHSLESNPTSHLQPEATTREAMHCHYGASK